MTHPTLMGTSGHQALNQSYSSGTFYSNIGLGRCAMIPGVTIESYASQTIRVSGAISYLSWALDTAFGAALTLTLNKNSSSSSLAISIGESTTGWVTDNTDSVSVSSGNVLDFSTSLSSTATDHSGSFYCVSARFDANTASAQMVATVGPAPMFYPTTTQKFANFLGILGEGDTTECEQQFQCLAAGTWHAMACYLESNGFNKTTTVNNRINSSNGSMAISILDGASGYFEDSSIFSDSVDVGDLLDYGFLASAVGNSNSFSISWIGAHFVATNSAQCMIGVIAHPLVKITSRFALSDFDIPDHLDRFVLFAI
jgi:hypothetical protein